MLKKAGKAPIEVPVSVGENPYPDVKLSYLEHTLLESFLVMSQFRNYETVKVEETKNKKTTVRYLRIPQPVDYGNVRQEYLMHEYPYSWPKFCTIIFELDSMFQAEITKKK